MTSLFSKVFYHCTLIILSKSNPSLKYLRSTSLGFEFWEMKIHDFFTSTLQREMFFLLNFTEQLREFYFTLSSQDQLVNGALGTLKILISRKIVLRNFIIYLLKGPALPAEKFWKKKFRIIFSLRPQKNSAQSVQPFGRL